MNAFPVGSDHASRDAGYRVPLSQSTVLLEPAATSHPDATRVAAAADLLSHWWSRPVASEVETWLASTDLAHDSFASRPVPMPSAAEAPRLLDEYERLFVGPGPVPCPPFESCWRHDVAFTLRRGLLGPCTADLREIYEQLGLELSLLGAEFMDFLPVELEALSVAMRRAGGSVSRSLFFDHLGRWLPEFTASVQSEARHPFYRDLAQQTMTYLRSTAATWTGSQATG